MAYGMEIRTVNGLENIENLRSLREVFRTLVTSTSASLSVPNGANASNSAVFFEINDGGTPLQFSWSGNTLNLSAMPFLPNPSSNFFVIVCRFK